MANEEAQLRPDGRTASKLLSAIEGEVTLIDSGGKIISSTAPSKGALGYPASFWRDRSIWEFTHPDDMTRAGDRMAEVLANPGKSITDRFRAKHSDGSWELVSMTGVNLLDDPEVNAIVLSTRSITDDVRVSNALTQTRDEALHEARMKSDFVAQVSHELRSPLHGILGMAELLVTAGLDEEPRRMARSIHAEASRLRSVIDDILDMSKIEAGRLDLEPVAFTVRAMLDQVVAVVRPLLDGDVDLQVEVADDVPERLRADRGRINQVILNLASNAAKFTTDGLVRIVVDVPGPDRLRVDVIDTGRGIGAEDQLELFRPFSQFGPASAKQAGTGLGLAICRQLVELMDGKMGVESEVGVGSAFWFDIGAPATTDVAVDEEPDQVASHAAQGFFGRSTVLVVDDNAVNQLVVGQQLARLGYEACVVGSGFDALDVLRERQIDAVLMDWHMPEIDGLETTKRIRDEEGVDGNRHVPIIAMTASAMTGDRERCLDAGMDDFLSKPASMEQIGVALGRWIEPEVDSAAPRSGDRMADGASAGAPRALVGSDVRTGIIDDLAEELGGVKVVAPVVQTYLDTLDERGSAMMTALEADDMNAAQRVAHSLKSPSAMLGAIGLSELCQAIEKGTTQETTSQLVTSLERLITNTSAELTMWLTDRSSR